MTAILGLNAYHGDSSACLVVDGQLVAAAEEERFRRTKHWAGFPEQAIRWCLESNGLSIAEIDHVAVSRNPWAQAQKKLLFALRRRPSAALVRSRLSNARQMLGVMDRIRDVFPTEREISAKFHRIEHHRAHSASAFLVSPFEDAAVVSIDAFGDFRSTMVSAGRRNSMRVLNTVEFPHSLGVLYTAVTQYLGFPKYGDEYKVMGLAPYGKPAYLGEFRKMISTAPGGSFKLNQDYFLHGSRGAVMAWNDTEPTIEPLFSDRMIDLLGPARTPAEELTGHHHDVAASLQAALEEAYFHILNYAQEATGSKRLALAGGVGYNSVANGKIFRNTAFDDVYIQAAAGDAGTAVGAAFAVHNQELGESREFVMDSAYWGPSFADEEMESSLTTAGLVYRRLDDDELFPRVAVLLADGKVVGWFQGRMEWGPRALGNRSILADPRRSEMREILNVKIKRREPFRPFAPSITVEAVSDYFEESYPDPFMIKVYPVRSEKRDVIPAVTHVDGTGRLQSVDRHQNPRYWRLLKAFEKVTGVPVLLNTSFNENEPIVCQPAEAIAAYTRTNMDVLVLGNFLVERDRAPDAPASSPDQAG